MMDTENRVIQTIKKIISHAKNILGKHPSVVSKVTANSIERNHDTWNTTYDWAQDGEEWSSTWGSKNAQWYGALYPRIVNWLPTDSLLEIAPGHGRWTEFLIKASSRYRGVDLAENCTEFCQKKFAGIQHASFFTNDGLSLPMIEDSSCDFVFSFDSLVHADLDVIKSYIPEILRVLKEDGAAFIHHSNAGEYFQNKAEIPGWRARNVTALSVADIIQQSGGFVWIQEKINWDTKKCIDCLTLFGKHARGKPRILNNELFMLEAMLIKTRLNEYLDL